MKTPNRLIHEQSQYLLQHAYNPVDWFPWGADAFKRAALEDKLVFLSIGYSTCHWCHVMAKESFQNDEIAGILNEHFVSVKVDREEHPDVDDFYMHACQAITGSGGWPLTIVMTPEKIPVFAGTYFPAEDSQLGTGLKTMLTSLNELWRDERDKLTALGTRILSMIEANGNDLNSQPDISLHFTTPAKSDLISAIEDGFLEIKKAYDPEFGGFFGGPKFPMPSILLFLLGYYSLSKDESAVTMVENTLVNMYKGGVYDHVGFGVCRYATDREWLIPHFEKMLYDNAQVSLAALEAYKVTHRQFYLRFGLEIIDYVMRTLKNPAGGFYTAEDADSEGEEGNFYLWAQEEIRQVLGEDAPQIISNYNVTEEGNFRGRNVLNLVGRDLSLKMDESTRKKLLDNRESRVHPMRDEKILIGPNSLMIVSLLRAYGVTGNADYLVPAESAIEFILDKCNARGRFHVGYRNGLLKGLATVDEYAYLLWALTEMYLHTLEPGYLQKAGLVAKEALDLFYDEKFGGFYLAGQDVGHLPVRRKTIYDGALPSGNSVMAYCLLRLSRLIHDAGYEDIALRQFEVFSGRIATAPTGFPFFLFALSYIVDGGTDVVITGPEPEPFHKKLVMEHQPFGTWAYADNLIDLIDECQGYSSKDGNTLAYVCKGKSCRPPVSSPGEMILHS